jgi:hypothetical protein
MALGGVLSVPSLADAVRSAPQGSLLSFAGKGVALVGGAAMLSLWLTAVWHAAVDRRRGGLQRGLLVAVLIVSNFVGGLAYYFLSVHWHRRSDSPG